MSQTAHAAPQAPTETWKILTLLSAVVFVAVVNGTMINVALPSIGAEFGASEGVYSWLVAGYSLTFGVFSAINGRLADLWGRRRLYVMGLVFVGLCSLAVAATPTLELGIALRILQGAGAAALPVLGTTIIKAVVPPQRRGRAIGVILSTVGVAASIGPFLGGLLVQMASWRIVFLVPGATLLAVPFALKLLPRSLDSSRGGSFDLLGSALMGSGIAALLYGFNVLQDQGLSLRLALVLAGGAAALGAFLLWIRRSREPLVSWEVLATPGYLRAAVLGTLTNATRFGSVVLAPIFLSELDKLEPIWIGLVLCPGAVAIALLSPRAGAMSDKHGPRRPLLISMGANLLGSLLTAPLIGASVWGVAATLGLFGLSFAFSQSPLLNTVTRMVPQEQEGSGIGFFMMIFFMGGAAGVTLVTTITELTPPMELVPGSPPEAAPFQVAMLALAALGALGVWMSLQLPTRETTSQEEP